MSHFRAEITSNTLVDYPRLEMLTNFMEETEYIPGLIAEVGVYKGGTAYLICELNEAREMPRPVVLFDTFTGMPQTSSFYDLHKEGDFNDTSLVLVKNLLKPYPETIICQGLFPTVHGKTFKECTFSFVHLDCDIYSSVFNSLEYFYPKMSPGGIIVLDDYNEPNCPGAKKAADEFFLYKKQKVCLTTQSQAFVRI